MQIQENSTVTLHFALHLDSGEQVDSTFDRRPATLTIGDGNLPEGFERCLMGLSAGDRRKVQVPPQDAFGQHNPQNIQQFKRDRFAQSEPLEVGMVMSFEDAGKNELPGVVATLDDEFVEVDFNHPLAGKTLDFDVEIIEVKEATDGH
ncbi:FKBP-type peptidyl-prolyl cis-trans isomerase [Saccharospirillum sp.]|uniref:FKBP-type peptidyl-prolyl cis-trans isomerase n=1 Tax=Saccharospirillum sp. TaxID=2033801 RepID=UPI00349FD70B